MKGKLFFIAAMAIMVSCDKQGPIGPIGEQGPAGTNGTNISSITTIIDSVVNTGWTSSSPFQAGFTNVNISIPDSDNVAVEACTYPGSSSPWHPLPALSYLSNNDQLTYSYTKNNFTVFYTYTNPPLVTVYFKITVISPSEAQRKAGNSSGKLLSY
jgi:hypothetical protein